MTITNWFKRTCKENITTLYYWLYTMLIMQSTGSRNIHVLLLFTLLCFSLKPAWFTGHENPPNKCAKITRQKNPPVKSAVKTCQIYARLYPAEFIRQEKAPLQLAAFACQRTPLPSSESPGKTRPAIPPPPPPSNSANGEGGRGQGTDPARPCILNRYFYFHSLYMNGYIFSYDTTYMHSIQSGL